MPGLFACEVGLLHAKRVHSRVRGSVHVRGWGTEEGKGAYLYSDVYEILELFVCGCIYAVAGGVVYTREVKGGKAEGIPLTLRCARNTQALCLQCVGA